MTNARPAQAVVPLKDRLLRLSAADCDAGNRLARYRSPFVCPSQFGEWRVRLCHPRAIATEGLGFAPVHAVVDGAPIRLFLPARALTAIAMQAKAEVNFAEVTDEGRALLFEHVLDDVLAALEQCGVSIAVQSIGNPERNPVGTMGVMVQFGALAPFGGLIDAPPAVGDWLLAEAESLPPPAPGFGATPVEMRILAGITRIAARSMAGLSVGDTVLFDHSWLPQRRLALVAGHRLLLAGATSARGVALVSPVPVSDLRERFHWLDDDPIAAGAFMDNRDTSTLDPLEVKLVFEMGRMTLSVAELGKLDAGHVFELNRVPDQAVDIFVMNRQIGTGELVMVGDKIGVRITRTNR